MLPVPRSRGHVRGPTSVAGRPALVNQAVLSGWQAALRPRHLRGPWHRHSTLVVGPLLRGGGEAAAPPKARPDRVSDLPALDAALPHTGAPADRALAIVGYYQARNVATRRAHAQRRRRYCEYLFR